MDLHETSPPPAGTVFAMPACFFGSSTFEMFSAGPGVSLTLSPPQYGSSEHDPLMRLPKTLKSFSFYGLDSRATFIDPVTGNGGKGSNNTYVPPSWPSFFAAHPSLIVFTVTGSNLGGPLPEKLPQNFIVLKLSNARLNGTIPSTIFDTPIPDIVTTSTSFDFSNNSLSGSIPRDLFTKKPSDSVKFIASFAGNDLTGSLPDNLFNIGTSQQSFEVNFDRNQLSGSINSSVFGNPSFNPYYGEFLLSLAHNRFTGFAVDAFSALPQLQRFSLDLTGNRLEGTISPFLGHMNLSKRFSASFKFGSNRLTGTLPDNLWPSSWAEYEYPGIVLDYSSNALSGTIPATLINTFNFAPSSVVLKLSNNSFTGTLPGELFQSRMPFELVLNLAHNRLIGPLTTPQNRSIRGGHLALDLSFNPIGGTIPEDYLGALQELGSWIDLKFSDCNLTGTLPGSNLGYRPNKSTYSLDLKNNALTGSYRFDELVSNISSQWTTQLKLLLQNNQLEGTISLPSRRMPPYYGASGYLDLYASSNRFTSLVMAGVNNYVTTLDVSDNLNLTGTLQHFSFNTSSVVKVLRARHTALSGPFPNVYEPGPYSFNFPLQEMDLSSTGIDFCNAGRLPWHSLSLSNCTLERTNAHQCASLYPSICLMSPPPPSTPATASPSAPISALPSTPHVPSTSPSNDSPNSQSPSSNSNPPSLGDPTSSTGPATPSSCNPTPPIDSPSERLVALIWTALAYFVLMLSGLL